MRDDAITQIAKLIDPDFDYGSDAVQADMRALALECFSVFLPSTMEILSEREALRKENARLQEENDAWRMDGGSCAEEVERLHKENARLRVVIKLADWLLEEIEDVEGINTLLQAEIARLRTVIKVKLYD